MKKHSTFLNIILLIGIHACVVSCMNPSSNTQISSPFFIFNNIIFPLQEDHVHGSTVVELPNGDMLAAWFQGSGERWADDVRIMGSRLLKGDTSWTAPFLMADKPGFPDVNPMLFIDPQERLWLMWYPVLANQWESSIPMYRISTDYLGEGPPKWGWQDMIFIKLDNTERGIQEGDKYVDAVQLQLDIYERYAIDTLLPQMPMSLQASYPAAWNKYRNKIDSLVSGRDMIRGGRIRKGGKEISADMGHPLSRRIGWQTKNKPYILDGRLIVPLYSDLLDASIFAITDDWGENWQFSNPVLGGAGIQATIACQRDGILVAYLRDNGPPPQRMQRTVSNNQGLSWSIARDSNLPNPGAGFDITTLQDGRWLIAFNNTEDGRHKLAIGLSSDEGKSWKIKQLENDERGNKATSFHYPAIIQSKDSRIHIVYSYHRKDQADKNAKSIKYVNFNLSWLISD